MNTVNNRLSKFLLVKLIKMPYFTHTALGVGYIILHGEKIPAASSDLHSENCMKFEILLVSKYLCTFALHTSVARLARLGFTQFLVIINKEQHINQPQRPENFIL